MYVDHIIFFYLQMILPKLICKEFYLIGLKLRAYKFYIPKVLRNITESSPNAFQVHIIWKDTQY